MKKKDTTSRFSDRVEKYLKYRPSYPEKIIEELQHKGILQKNSIIADIGSGTGIFSKLLLKFGCKVIGIEPNTEMREAGELFLSEFSNFESLKGRAEETNLQNNSIDIITVAQAFHWFDLIKTRKEFLRILKSNGYLILIWNERLIDEIPFQKDYDVVLRKLCPEYKKPSYHKVSLDQIQQFYGHNKFEIYTCKNYQLFDYQSFIGRLESSSYCLTKSDKNYDLLMRKMRELFEKYSENNRIRLEYITKMYYGQMS